MIFEIIKTDNYLLVVDDSEIKEDDWYKTPLGIYSQFNGTEKLLEGTKRVAAHLPLNGSPILEGVALLPPYSRHQEDDINDLAEISSELQEGTYTTQHRVTYKHGFVDGYNKAKEKYKYTEEDVRKAIDMARELDGLHYKNGAAYKIIQSLHQYPTEFECEVYNTEELESAEIDWMIIGRPKRITTAQGIQWVGKYK